jgi:hypothetical protein
VKDVSIKEKTSSIPDLKKRVTREEKELEANETDLKIESVAVEKTIEKPVIEATQTIRKEEINLKEKEDMKICFSSIDSKGEADKKTKKKPSNIDRLKNQSRDLRKNCFNEVKKILSGKSLDMYSYMSVVEIYKGFFNPSNIVEFCNEIKISEKEFIRWVDVYDYCWKIFSDHEYLNRYSVEELSELTLDSLSKKTEADLKRMIVEKIDMRYLKRIESLEGYCKEVDKFFMRIDIKMISTDKISLLKETMRVVGSKIRNYEMELNNGKQSIG